MELKMVGGGCEKGCMDHTQSRSHLVAQKIQIPIRKIVEHFPSGENCCDCRYAAPEAVQQECRETRRCLGNVPVIVGEVNLTLMIKWCGRTRKFEGKSCCQGIVALSLGMMEGKLQALENDNWWIGEVLNLVDLQPQCHGLAGSLNPSHQKTAPTRRCLFPGLQAKLVGTFPSYSG